MMAGRSKHFYEFGPYRIDVSERLLLRSEQPVALTIKAFETLLMLVENSGHVLRKDELINRVWPDTFVEEANLANNISQLRSILGGRHYIETIPKRGYRFAANVKELWEGEKDRVSQDPSQTVTAVREETFRTIAVVPFTSLSRDDRDDYLGMAVADALITRLTKIRQIVVRPTSAIRDFTGPARDPVAVGRKLHVELVLDGSIQRLGERIRVTVQLVKVSDGSPLWAEKFDEKFIDIFSVEDSISEQVAESLTLNLSSEERKRLTKHFTENVEAYKAYLKGRYYSNKWTREGFKKEIEYFNQAIKVDPTYALAYAGLADTYYRASTVYLPPSEAMPKTRAAALKALESDDTLAEAHASLGLAREYYDWDWKEAEKEFKRAIELNPNYAIGRLWFGLYLMEMGRLEESIIELSRAQYLDPLSLEINAFLALPFYCSRQYDQAIEQLQKTIEMDPNYAQAHYFLGWVYEQEGRLTEAIEEYQTSMKSAGRFPLALAALGHALALSGKREEAQQVLHELNELSQQIYVSAYDRAIVYLGLGERDQAFEWFQKAFAERSVWLVRLNVDRRLDEVRSEARFIDLMHRVGLKPGPYLR